MSSIKKKTWFESNYKHFFVIGLWSIFSIDVYHYYYFEGPMSAATIILYSTLWILLALTILIKSPFFWTESVDIDDDMKALIKQGADLFEESVGNMITDALGKDIQKNIYNRLAHSKLSVEESRKQAEEQFNVIKQRVEDMESRFPDKNSIAKIASMNDVLFFERIEQLSKKIEKIEEKILTKWDIAIICGAMFTGVFAILSVVTIVIDMLV